MPKNSFQAYMNVRTKQKKTGQSVGSSTGSRSQDDIGNGASSATNTGRLPGAMQAGLGGTDAGQTRSGMAIGGNRKPASSYTMVGGDRPTVVSSNTYTGQNYPPGQGPGGGPPVSAYPPDTLTDNAVDAAKQLANADPSAFGRSRLARGLQEAEYGNVWQNPDQLAALWFNQYGYNPYGSGYAVAQDMSQKIPLMWLLESPKDSLLGGVPSYADFFQRYMNRATGSGANPDSYAVLNSIFGAQPGSAAYAMLANPQLGANDQVQNLLSTFETAMGGTLPTPILQMFLDDMAYQGQQWASQRFNDPLNKGGGTFMDWYRQNAAGGDPFANIVR